jgi:amidase
VDGAEVAYLRHLVWAGLATLPGLPATAIPVALSDEGLPIGLQVIGPLWGDMTTLAAAGLIETLNGGFRPPPGY